MNDERFNEFIRVRFIIPLKIIIGAFVAVILLPILRPEADLTHVFITIADVITYSLIACMLYFAGDYVVYVTQRIYLKITKKEKKE